MAGSVNFDAVAFFRPFWDRYCASYPNHASDPDDSLKFLAYLVGGLYGRVSAHDDLLLELERKVRQLTSIIERS